MGYLGPRTNKWTISTEEHGPFDGLRWTLNRRVCSSYPAWNK